MAEAIDKLSSPHEQMKRSERLFLAFGNILNPNDEIILKITTGGEDIQYLVMADASLEHQLRQVILSVYETARIEEVSPGDYATMYSQTDEAVLDKHPFRALMPDDESARVDLHKHILEAFQYVKKGEVAEFEISFKLAPKRTKKLLSYSMSLDKSKEGNNVLRAKASGTLFEAYLRVKLRASAERTETLSTGFKTALTAHLSSEGEYNAFAIRQAEGRGGVISAFNRLLGKVQVLNSSELASLFYLPEAEVLESGKMKRQMIKEVDGAITVSSGIYLGQNEFRGDKKPVFLSDEDRRRHTYILGQTGTGKSRLLENLALQDISRGRGLAFIDPHGDSAEEILRQIPLHRSNDVIYFNPADMEFPIGLNLFEYDRTRPEQRDFVIGEAISILYALYDPDKTGIIGPRYEHWFRNAALTLMSDPNGCSFLEVPKLFTDKKFLEYKLQFVNEECVLDFWNSEMKQVGAQSKAEMLGWFISKFGAFASNQMMRGIIGQNSSGFDFRSVMDEGKILVVNLSKGKLGEINSGLLGMILVMKMMMAAMSRADSPESERRDFTLYVDEFQSFATDSFATLLSEARKYRFDLILANQFMAQLSSKVQAAILGNVGTVICGRVGANDAEIMAKRFLPVFDSLELTRLPNFQAVASVLVDNTPSGAFNLQLANPGKKLEQTDDFETLLERSRLVYGTKRQEEPNYVTVVHNKSSQKSYTISSNCSNFLQEWRDIKKNL
ncbi:TraM recognition domain-containing protein [Candidatus Saccharibacteria bacterium]|nr:TraM recognition domain-containing protein [Candidatus Saccharibacteria bacterium]